MSKIEWTEKTWNPIVGCSVVSPGCTNCYAMTMAARLERMGLERYRGLTKPSKAGPVWTGETRLVDETLTEPLRRRKPTMWFVNSMSDLFHESVPDAWIDRVFAVMALCPHHTMQVLTKRSARMRAYMNDPHTPYRVARAMDAVLVDLDHDPVERWSEIPGYPGYEASTHGAVRSPAGPLATGNNPLHAREQVTLWNGGAPRTWFVHALVLMAHRGLPPEGHEARHRNGDKADNRLANLLWGTRSDNQADKVRHGSIGGPQKLTIEQVAAIRAVRAAGTATQQQIADEYGISRSLVSMIESGRVWASPIPWPLTSVWLGVSAEDQRRADERVPDLLATPAAVRFVSAEPLLGPLDLTSINTSSDGYSLRLDALRGISRHKWHNEFAGPGYDPGAYGMIDSTKAGLDWIIVGGESGPGARPMHPAWARSIRDQCETAGVPFFFKQWGSWAVAVDRGKDDPDWRRDYSNSLNDRRADIAWLNVDGGRGFHGEDFHVMRRVSKTMAGRLLDDVEHNGMPSTTPSEAAA